MGLALVATPLPHPTQPQGDRAPRLPPPCAQPSGPEGPTMSTESGGSWWESLHLFTQPRVRYIEVLGVLKRNFNTQPTRSMVLMYSHIPGPLLAGPARCIAAARRRLCCEPQPCGARSPVLTLGLVGWRHRGSTSSRPAGEPQPARSMPRYHGDGRYRND